MSIDRVNISNQGIDRSQAAQPKDLTRSDGKDRQAATGSDSVALSSKASELGRLAKHVEQSRAEQMARIRAELESGRYHISANDLAEKLIDSNRR
jgi:flagellar biosynthesis anti-sigma factor FlgM